MDLCARTYDSQLHGFGRFVCAGEYAVTTSVEKPTGQYDHRWENCAEYVGEWKRDTRDGVGVMIGRDGTTVKGLWAKDQFVRELDACTVTKVRTTNAKVSPLFQGRRARTTRTRPTVLGLPLYAYRTFQGMHGKL